jgi:hypothetical protein
MLGVATLEQYFEKYRTPGAAAERELFIQCPIGMRIRKVRFTGG